VDRYRVGHRFHFGVECVFDGAKGLVRPIIGRNLESPPDIPGDPDAKCILAL